MGNTNKISQYYYNKRYNTTIPLSHHIMMLPNEKNTDEKQNKNYNLNSINILQKQQQHSSHRSLSLSQNINKRYYHTTMHNNKGISIVMGLGAVALTAKAGQYTIQA